MNTLTETEKTTYSPPPSGESRFEAARRYHNERHALGQTLSVDDPQYEAKKATADYLTQQALKAEELPPPQPGVQPVSIIKPPETPES